MFRAEQGCIASPDIVVRKPGALWDALLKNFSLATVEDLSPGSGSLATACMRSGVGCVCYVWSSLHATWLGNVLNREAAKLIVDTDSVLYQGIGPDVQRRAEGRCGRGARRASRRREVTVHRLGGGKGNRVSGFFFGAWIVFPFVLGKHTAHNLCYVVHALCCGRGNALSRDGSVVGAGG